MQSPLACLDVFTQRSSFVFGDFQKQNTPNDMVITRKDTGETLCNLHSFPLEQLDDALGFAKQAFKTWRHTKPHHKAKLLQALATSITDHLDDLAHLLTLEQGKRLDEAKAEIAEGARSLQFCAGEAMRVAGEILPTLMDSPQEGLERTNYVYLEPVGVVVSITPWNFPLGMITRKIGPALAAGCTVVVKPSFQTPLCALALAKLAKDAGFPPGVLQVILVKKEEDDVFGKRVCASAHVAKVGFTGSTRVGKLLAAQCGQHLKKTALELGGHAPAIISGDVGAPQPGHIDLAYVAKEIAFAKFRNAGQTCICVNRAYIHVSIFEAMVKLLEEEANQLVVGSGFAPETQMGPLINEDALQKVEAHLADALAKGARLVCGGKRIMHEGGGGAYFAPTVLRDVTPDMLVMHEETFGPLLPCLSFETQEEACAMANSLPYGLAAYVFTNDLHLCQRIGSMLDFGMIAVNTGRLPSPNTPFGGIKASGIGREGGRYALREYLEEKSFSVVTTA